MPAYQNIVFGTDFSEQANKAFEEAKYLAGLAGGKLHVIHVVPGAMVGGEEAGTASLEERYRAEGAEYRVLHGHEASELMKFAEGLPGAVIVVGARGVGVLTGLFGGGSICDKVVANAKCPVLVVPGE